MVFFLKSRCVSYRPRELCNGRNRLVLKMYGLCECTRSVQMRFHAKEDVRSLTDKAALAKCVERIEIRDKADPDFEIIVIVHFSLLDADVRRICTCKFLFPSEIVHAKRIRD